MNKLIIILLLISHNGFSQTYRLYQTKNIHNQLKLNTKTGEVMQIQDDGQKFLVHDAVTLDSEKINRYELIETKNLWTYILLDKFSGKIWQCQYSVEGTEYISSWTVNSKSLSNTETEKFTVEPLTSMFQFYLINQETGEMWKFQWSTDKDESYRWIKKL